MNMVETRRLILCPFNMEDSAEYFDVICDSDIRKYVPYAGCKTLESAKKLVNTYCQGDFKHDFYFEIREKSSNKIVGAIIATSATSSILDVCYLIGSAYRGNGYMQEALLGFINFLRDNFNKHLYSLDFTIENENVSSQHVVRNCGGKVFRNLSKSTIWRIKPDYVKLI